MRIIFMGSAELSCPSLKALLNDDRVELCAVVCQPDRASGRGRKKLTCCPTKEVALGENVEVLTPEKVNAPDVVERLRSYKPDMIVVIAYGQILRKDILSMPPMGCVNIHGSLLPKYRGAAPIQWAVANGDDVTGVTSMMMDEGMDTGAMLLKKEVAIEQDDTAGTMYAKLAEAGAEVLMDTLNGLAEGKILPEEQNDGEATIAPKLSKTDGCIDWNSPAHVIEARIRGFNPWPVCWTRYDAESGMMGGEGQLLKVWKAEIAGQSGNPGEVLEISKDGPLIAAGDKALRLIEVQPEGGKMMSGSAYAAGRMKNA